MRHRTKTRNFSMVSSRRVALFRALVTAIVTRQAIKTTLIRAKELRGVVEPLITLAKEDTLANRRLAFNRIRDKAVVAKLFNVLGPHYKARPGGYLRVLKCGFRAGDKAPMAYVELVGKDEIVETANANSNTAKAVVSKSKTEENLSQ